MKKLASMLLAVAMLFTLAACSSAPAEDTGSEIDYSVISTDTATKTVKIYTQVNGKYFTESSRHGIVFEDGSNGEKCILRGLCDEKEFYGALISIGANPGDNITAEDGAIIDGDKLDITLSWEGSDGEVNFADCIVTGDGKPYELDARFGGNIKNAYAKNTGCIFCLESCPVGITSNASYGYGVIENTKTQEFYGNPDVLPEDGTIVTATFTLLA